MGFITKPGNCEFKSDTIGESSSTGAATLSTITIKCKLTKLGKWFTNKILNGYPIKKKTLKKCKATFVAYFYIVIKQTLKWQHNR